MIRRRPRSPLFPYTTLFRSGSAEWEQEIEQALDQQRRAMAPRLWPEIPPRRYCCFYPMDKKRGERSEEHTSELQSHHDLVCRLLLEKKKTKVIYEHNDRSTL